MAFGTLGSKQQDVELSWHDWNVAKDISHDGQFVLFEDSSEVAGPGYAVALRKLDGSLPVRLGDGSAGGLSPDGKWAISVFTGNPERMTLLPIGAGEPRTVNLSGWNTFITVAPTSLRMGTRLTAHTAMSKVMRTGATSWT